MDGIKRTLTGLVSNKKFLIVFILTLIFIAAALYTYKTYIKSKVSPTYVANNEFVQGPKPTTEVVDLYFFYTTWCPHCKKAKPVWEQLKNEIGDNPYKGVKINFLEVDCDQDRATADKFEIDGYPTIKMVKGNQIILYDAKPSRDNLIQFLDSSL